MSTAAPGDKDKDIVRFPPFPTAPEGVTIVPFKDWKETGIQIFSTRSVGKVEGNEDKAQDLFDDDIEVDGLGIPTVELSKKHDTDVGKSDARKRRKARGVQRVAPARNTSGVPQHQRPWWEIWEDVEENRLAGPYEGGTTRMDRIYQAAHDFKASRPWPPGTTGADYLWDQWRLYAGLRAIMPIWRRTDKLDKGLAEDDAVLGDGGSDDGEPEDGPSAEVVMGAQQRPNKRPRPRPPYYNYGTDPVEVNSDEAVRNLLEEEQYKKDDKLVDFVNNMEKNTAIFLSSYMRDQGLIWSDRYLDGMPRILHFFLRFIRRNRLLPDPQHERNIAATIPLIELAIKELPLTSKIAKLYPDRFSQGAMECWGAKAKRYAPLFPESDAPSPSRDADVEEVRTPAAEETSTPQIVEPGVTAGEWPGNTVNEDNGNATWDAFDQDQVVPNTGWDSTQTWGEPLNTSDRASVSAEPETSTFDFLGEEMDTSQNPWAVPEQDWSPPKPHSLMNLLGPTALPLTHTTGIVESSMRRLKSVAMPPTTSLKKLPSSEIQKPSAVGVEHDLETTFAKVVFGPWLGWDHHGDVPFSEPKILDTSQGSAITLLPEERNPAAPSTEKGIHDMYKDDITALVEPKVAEVMGQGIGMGYGGTWVQIVRREEVGGETQGSEANKRSKGKKPNAMKYWYNDELMMIIPSFNL
ncbi:hypothetical protein BDN72DRAFT_793465 [Pluteus cervinus]|uniref:Uncharacterized protein n=1 Tax=Pluteus cervinus TaxID=181527 RepID=A0ACD3B2A4_9AGAR|nr:hypothetical protein BDN72DRAFT_793465 [Pluteus cervinus]